MLTFLTLCIAAFGSASVTLDGSEFHVSSRTIPEIQRYFHNIVPPSAITVSESISKMNFSSVASTTKWRQVFGFASDFIESKAVSYVLNIDSSKLDCEKILSVAIQEKSTTLAHLCHKYIQGNLEYSTLVELMKLGIENNDQIFLSMIVRNNPDRIRIIPPSSLRTDLLLDYDVAKVKITLSTMSGDSTFLCFPKNRAYYLLLDIVSRARKGKEPRNSIVEYKFLIGATLISSNEDFVNIVEGNEVQMNLVEVIIPKVVIIKQLVGNNIVRSDEDWVVPIPCDFTQEEVSLIFCCDILMIEMLELLKQKQNENGKEGEIVWIEDNDQKQPFDIISMCDNLRDNGCYHFWAKQSVPLLSAKFRIIKSLDDGKHRSRNS